MRSAEKQSLWAIGLIASENNPPYRPVLFDARQNNEVSATRTMLASYSTGCQALQLHEGPLQQAILLSTSSSLPPLPSSS